MPDNPKTCLDLYGHEFRAVPEDDGIRIECCICYWAWFIPWDSGKWEDRMACGQRAGHPEARA